MTHTVWFVYGPASDFIGFLPLCLLHSKVLLVEWVWLATSNSCIACSFVALFVAINFYYWIYFNFRLIFQFCFARRSSLRSSCWWNRLFTYSDIVIFLFDVVSFYQTLIESLVNFRDDKFIDSVSVNSFIFSCDYSLVLSTDFRL